MLNDTTPSHPPLVEEREVLELVNDLGNFLRDYTCSSSEEAGRESLNLRLRIRHFQNRIAERDAAKAAAVPSPAESERIRKIVVDQVIKIHRLLTLKLDDLAVDETLWLTEVCLAAEAIPELNMLLMSLNSIYWHDYRNVADNSPYLNHQIAIAALRVCCHKSASLSGWTVLLRTIKEGLGRQGYSADAIQLKLQGLLPPAPVEETP